MPSNLPGVTAFLRAVDRRGDTDERPSYFVHVVLPILLAIAGVLAAAGIVVGTAGLGPTLEDTIASASPTAVGAAALVAALGFLAAGVLAVVGFYKVLRRRERHFARDRVLREGLIAYGQVLASRSGDRAAEHVEAMVESHHDAAIDDTRKPAAVHLVLLALFPLWGLYIVYYLTRDFARHARRQEHFLRELRNLVDEAGLELAEVQTAPGVRERSFLLSLVLILVVPFGTLVVLYWLYTDPEQHFDHQWRHEDALVEAIAEGPAAEALEDAPAPDAPPPGAGAASSETDAEGPGADAEEDAPAPEPEFTVWECPECAKKYKVPPERPVRVTCKECEHQEILEE